MKSRQPKEEDLIDVYEVARRFRLKHRTSVSTYMKKYPDMPRPIERGHGPKASKWSKAAFESWFTKKFGNRG